MDTLVFVAAADEFAVVSFRGTMDLRNWLTDLDCKRVAMNRNLTTDFSSFAGPSSVAEAMEDKMEDRADYTDDVEVHEGFQRALEGVWARILRIVERMEGRKRIYFTGHSLGGPRM